MTLRAVLLGYGLAGRVFHAPLIGAEPDIEIAAVVTSDPARQQQVRDDLPGVSILTHADEAWDQDFDLAVIATANSAHVPQATAALHAGMHVVVDKPLAGSAREAQALIDLAASSGRQVHVFQNRRWDSEILTARRCIDEGLLGTPHRLESRFERWRPAPKGGWREEGPPEDLPGLLYDLGAHLVDQALHLLGPVGRVFASSRHVREGVTADDDTQIVLEHVSGAVSILSVSSVAAFVEPRLRLLGTGGGLLINTLDTQEDALRAGRDPRDPDWGAESEQGLLVTGTSAPVSLGREPGAWPEYYRRVARAIRGEGPAPVDPRDVVADLRVIEAARESALLGQAVALDPPAGHVALAS
ncbi:MAG: Gfo/Idh/MocA family oxidoreductase [Candidatus Nanopelagicales bacterium]